MSQIDAARSFYRDLRRKCVEVNRFIYPIDPVYVWYRWYQSIVSQAKTLASFVIGAFLIGKFVETGSLSWSLVISGITAYGVYHSVSGILESMMRERNALFRTKLSTKLDQTLMTKLMSLDLGRLVDPAFVELTQMARRRGSSSIQRLWYSQIEFFGALTGLVASASLLLVLDPLLSVMALVVAVPSMVKKWFYEEKHRELDLQETIVHREMFEINHVLTWPRSSVLTRMLRFGSPLLQRYTGLTEVLFENVRALARLEKRWSIGVGLTTLIGTILVCSYFASGLVAGKYSVIQIGAIIGSFRMVTDGMSRFAWTMTDIENERRDYGYLEKFLATVPLVDEAHSCSISLKTTPELVCEAVSFAYPRSDKHALNDCDITIRPGEKVAFVGPNGCGKTTLLRLLAGIYRPSTGNLWINARPIDTVLQEAWLKHMVLVTQDAHLPDLDLISSLTGHAENREKDRLGKALVFAGVDSFIDELPYGLETWIGAEWEKGRGFSSGQLQRLALAATFYRFLDPDVYIGMFDEPTANCDASTKARFYHSVTKSPEFEHKTAIVTLHDPLYLQFFDRVVLFEKGRVVKDLRGLEQIQEYRADIALALSHDL